MLQRDFAFRIYREIVYQANRIGSNSNYSSSLPTIKTEDGIKKEKDEKDVRFFKLELELQFTIFVSSTITFYHLII
jgi:hypothetical protein